MALFGFTRAQFLVVAPACFLYYTTLELV